MSSNCHLRDAAPSSNLVRTEGLAMASTRDIASALCSIATPGMKAKELRTAIKARYPDANEFHNFAPTERIAGDKADEMTRVSKSKTRKRNRDAHGRSSTH